MILTRAMLLGHDPTPAWSAHVALLCPGDSVAARDVLRATLDAVTPGVPCAHAAAVADAVFGAKDALRHGATTRLLIASMMLRGRYDDAAGPRLDGFARATHASRFSAVWCDPDGDAPDLLPLAAAVAAVYAVEAWATGERESIVAYYVRAAWGWR